MTDYAIRYVPDFLCIERGKTVPFKVGNKRKAKGSYKRAGKKASPLIVTELKTGIERRFENARQAAEFYGYAEHTIRGIITRKDYTHPKYKIRWDK